MSRPDPEQLQGTLVDFALLELIRQHRESFQPLWTVDSWAKLMIWLSLNCGLSGERDTLEHFASALGERITSRLRRTFFERELADLELQVLADPAEHQVLLLSQAPEDPAVLNPDQLSAALDRVGLTGRVMADRSRWQRLEGVVAIPWKD
ncbi:protein phosphatase [Synechococcus sp. UW179A]|uniref:protein phosphatase n=1 Tax=Synechococcus sp. UW179A TaxID=2575510 RepID=UPI000E0F76CD|nr:protein phosphatase [Synechococcus sp. UW179A]